MTIRTYRYNGTTMIDPTTTPNNYLTSEEGNLTHAPINHPTGTAQHTHYPLEGSNIYWNTFKTELYRYTPASPIEYETTLQLYGLNHNMVEELIGEQIYTTSTSPATTDIVGFDLQSSSAHPPLTNTTPTATNGTIEVDLPIRWQNFEDMNIVLYKNFTDNFTDNSIGTGWVVSTPVGDITETGGVLTIDIDNGVDGDWTGVKHNAPHLLYPIPTTPTQWRATVYMTSSPVNDSTHSGMCLYKDNDNVYLWGRKHDNTTDKMVLDKIVGDVKTESVETWNTTTLPTYFSILYIDGSYYFDLSPTGTGWTNVYNTNTLGFTPTHIGFFTLNHTSSPAISASFDNFQITDVLGNSTYNTTITPTTTPGDDDLEVTFTTPTGWVDGSYGCLSYNKYGNLTEYTNPIPLQCKGVVKMGYNGLDKYDALRVKVETTATTPYVTRWNWWEYRYEVYL
jgi:hypothetical protein